MRKTHPIRSLALALTILAFGLVSAAAHSVESGDIMVGHIWSYPTQTNAAKTSAYGLPAGTTAIDIFGPFLNKGQVADAIVGVSSPAASSPRLVMWVRGVQIVGGLPLTLPAGKPVALGPQTQFLRFYGARKVYKAGDSFPITLHFRQAPDATIDVVVQSQPGPG